MGTSEVYNKVPQPEALFLYIIAKTSPITAQQTQKQKYGKDTSLCMVFSLLIKIYTMLQMAVSPQ
jgi:hypothetical protein